MSGTVQTCREFRSKDLSRKVLNQRRKIFAIGIAEPFPEMKDEFYEFIGPRLDTRSAKDKTQMLIDGFEKFQKNFELSDEEIDTLKITFIKEIFENSKFLLYTIFCGFIDLIFIRKMLSQIF